MIRYRISKKGFTLIELLAVIVVLGIILVIAIPSVGKLIKSSKEKAYKEQAQLLIDKASLLYTLSDKDFMYYSLEALEYENQKSPYGHYLEENSFVIIKKEEGIIKKSIYLSDKKGNSIGLLLNGDYYPADLENLIVSNENTILEEITSTANKKIYINEKSYEVENNENNENGFDHKEVLPVGTVLYKKRYDRNENIYTDVYDAYIVLEDNYDSLTLAIKIDDKTKLYGDNYYNMITRTNADNIEGMSKYFSDYDADLTFRLLNQNDVNRFLINMKLNNNFEQNKSIDNFSSIFLLANYSAKNLQPNYLDLDKLTLNSNTVFVENDKCDYIDLMNKMPKTGRRDLGNCKVYKYDKEKRTLDNNVEYTYGTEYFVNVIEARMSSDMDDSYSCLNFYKDPEFKEPLGRNVGEVCDGQKQ